MEEPFLRLNGPKDNLMTFNKKAKAEVTEVERLIKLWSLMINLSSSTRISGG